MSVPRLRLAFGERPLSAGFPPDVRPRVLIASEHEATRTGIRLALAGEADCVEADDPVGAVAAGQAGRADVYLIDFDPPRRAIRTAAEITSTAPDALVVVLTRRVDDNELLAAVRAGATGYLARTIAPDLFPHVIRSLLRGEAAIPRGLVRLIAQELRGDPGPRRLDLGARGRIELTGRESAVVEGLRQGLTTRELAALLGISEVTVRRHVSAVHRKLGTASRAELVGLLADGAPA